MLKMERSTVGISFTAEEIKALQLELDEISVFVTDDVKVAQVMKKAIMKGMKATKDEYVERGMNSFKEYEKKYGSSKKSK